MKFLFIIAFLAANGYSQETLYLKKIDTLFIVYDNTLSNNHIIREYSEIKSKSNSIIGLNSIYFLLDSTKVNKREEFYMRFKESITKGNMPGASSPCDWCFGLSFVHKSKVQNNLDDFKNDIQYKMLKKHHMEKYSVTKKDSLLFNKAIYAFINYRYNPPSSNILLSKKELKEKNIFYFDGSTKKYNELKELVKEPHYIYFLEKKWIKQELNSKYSKTEYYIFNEVMFYKTRNLYPELH